MMRFTATVAPVADDISRLTEEVADFLDGAGVDARATHHVCLVIDEILTNVGEHGGGKDAPATIVIEVKPDRIAAEIVDRGGPFDPRTAPAPDLTAALEDRKVGGLGLHLVRQLTAVLDYRHDGQQNWTSFCIMREQATPTGA